MEEAAGAVTTQSGFSITIRPERPQERDTVDRLIYTAFAHSYGADTGALMLRYFQKARGENAFIPELSFVALDGAGEIIGQVTLYETDIDTPAGKNTQLVLSQSAVLPGYRGRGVMRALVAHALGRAEEMGYGAVFLGGDPELYGRFGFVPSYRYGIHHVKSAGNPAYAEGCLVRPLRPGALEGVTGTTSYYAGE